MEKKENFLIYLLIVITITTVNCTYTVNYGSLCNDYYICDYSKYLICLESVCNCSSPEGMVYNDTTESCQVLLGKSCRQEEFNTRNIYKFSGRGDVLLGSHTVKFSRTLPCASGAICADRNICDCPKYEDYVVINGICKPKINVRSDNKNSTGGPPPGNPELIQTKTWNSPCDYREENDCPSGTGLVCIDEKCKCRIESDQYFNGTKCVSLVDKLCGKVKLNAIDDIDIDCTQFAFCYENQNHSSYIQTETGMCRAGYNGSCSAAMHCDQNGNFKCIGGKCQCEQIVQTYDENVKRCRGLVGASCVFVPSQRVPYIFRNLPIKTKEFCFRYAFCDGESKSDIELGKGVCKCRPGLTEKSDGTCNPPFNAGGLRLR